MGETVYYVKNRKIAVTCPRCRYSKVVSASKFLDQSKSVKLRLRCPCGHTHKALLERRSYERKFTPLEGRYIYLTDKFIQTEGDILVRDLSIDGIGFIMMKTPSIVPLPGDPLSVHFRINELPGAMFKKEVVVQSFRGGRVGARFLQQINYATDKPLKIFLLS